MYYFAIVNELHDNKEDISKQDVTDDHELIVMELIDHIWELIEEPSQAKTGPENDRAAPKPIKCSCSSIDEQLFCR